MPTYLTHGQCLLIDSSYYLRRAQAPSCPSAHSPSRKVFDIPPSRSFPIPRSFSPPDWNCLPESDQHWLKVRLRNNLQAGDLSSMPSWFPFLRLMPSSCPSSPASYQSYEFRQEFPTSSGGCAVTFSFCAVQEQLFTWRIALPSSQWQTEGQPMTMAQVQVHRSVMNTPYWRFMEKDPSVILRALSTSLELGVLITIAPRQLFSQEISYMATSIDGKQEILYSAQCQ
ncbi:uncharacterized protein BT62DRAFT_577637 [Guyanagaster necrorhizus]|uniref:Uncharacterized protein n=1 Tax=Guyanagaster necrorhizus TaxID=856835 RepID=A0A9P7VHC0_9AGAR|nr:uncharacterized protein BT62DRAFT_577637 [Guyanagaster necrorhizus MCA 3950]KAG7440597.1 hypothetical protein BT62DRAFT_577637 [Guyanagaster necrorhizus MCA 3950]